LKCDKNEAKNAPTKKCLSPCGWGVFLLGQAKIQLFFGSTKKILYGEFLAAL
jgi:hypothetical protein